MRDTVAMKQIFADARQQGVVEHSGPLDEVGRQRDLRRAQRPNVKVMDPGNLRQSGEIGSHGGGVNVFRDGIEGEV